MSFRRALPCLISMAVLSVVGCSSGASKPEPPSPNLVPNSGFNQGTDLHGVAEDVTVWGAAKVSLTSAVAITGTSAEVVTLPAGGTGGIYVQVPVEARLSYTQSADIDVVDLARGATAAMILEWYDGNLNLLGYQMDRFNIVGGGFEHRVQTVRSPNGAVLARFVVNISGGGQVLIDAPQLQAGTRATAVQFTAPGIVTGPTTPETARPGP